MNAPHQSPDNRTASPLVYILIFTSFALFALTLLSDRIAKRQTRIEQQFHGIEAMQRGGPEADGVDGGSGNPRTPDQQPLIITLRPLMLSLAVVMVAAWAALMWRRLRPAASAEPDTTDA